jgi:hypothetical protein
MRLEIFAIGSCSDIHKTCKSHKSPTNYETAKMISTSAMRLARAPVRRALTHNFTQQTTPAIGSAITQPAFTTFFNSPKFHSTIALDQPLNFPAKEIGKVERTLKALDMALVR